MRMHRIAASLIVGASAATALLCGGCAKNAATGRTQFNTLSREDEIALGTQAAPELAEQYGGRYPDEQVQSYVAEVGMKLVAQTEADYATLPWEFTVLDSDIINAFSLPGGKVFLSMGLAKQFENEAELAGVLGHEIGHVTAEHADKRISNQTAFQGILAGVGIAAGVSESAIIAEGVPVLVSATGQGFLLQWGRDEEYEADNLGVRYMAKAGYDPRGQVRVMEILRDEAGPAGQPEWLSTHPYPENRITRLEKLINREFPNLDENPSLFTWGEERFQQRFLSRVR